MRSESKEGGESGESRPPGDRGSGEDGVPLVGGCRDGTTEDVDGLTGPEDEGNGVTDDDGALAVVDVVRGDRATEDDGAPLADPVLKGPAPTRLNMSARSESTPEPPSVVTFETPLSVYVSTQETKARKGGGQDFRSLYSREVPTRDSSTTVHTQGRFRGRHKILRASKM